MKIISNTATQKPEDINVNQIKKGIELSLAPTSETSTSLPGLSVNRMPSDTGRLQIEASLQTLLTEMHTLQEKIEQVRTRLTEQLLQNTRQVAKLSEEVVALHEAIAEMKAPKGANPPTPVPNESEAAPSVVWIETAQPIVNTPPAPAPASETSPGLPSDNAPTPPRSEDRITETPPDIDVLPLNETQVRKVAFITKLWDYLNHAAIEIPLHKKNRSN